MNFTIITALFLAAGAAADYTTCSKNRDARGVCNVYTDGGVYTGRSEVCRGAHSCLVEGNGCWMSVEYTTGAEGGWYADCS
ncbi:D-lactate dehydrogenase [Venturia nashicola]|uniref:D-lactate dehydrogenase n=1 Tax=Venturia nashicola TaxID=86259 RepID=A0A4Z1NKD1_9PEZI|nr:D-lactate dehydrogenase [Venturia nashicola]TLD15315.1 D-lactate dehydrogenase [Venturia nashicola]